MTGICGAEAAKQTYTVPLPPPPPPPLSSHFPFYVPDRKLFEDKGSSTLCDIRGSPETFPMFPESLPCARVSLDNDQQASCSNNAMNNTQYKLQTSASTDVFYKSCTAGSNSGKIMQRVLHQIDVQVDMLSSMTAVLQRHSTDVHYELVYFTRVADVARDTGAEDVAQTVEDNMKFLHEMNKTTAREIATLNSMYRHLCKNKCGVSAAIIKANNANNIKDRSAGQIPRYASANL